MGPTAIFDKSFLQTLTVDESVWFDHFFVPVISPLFFVETLADLEKENIRSGRTPEDEVRIIAEKTPEMNSVPHIHHAKLCRDELLGLFKVPFQGRPVIPSGKRAILGSKKGIVVEISAEADALARWRNEEFREVERRFAKKWRIALGTADRNAGKDFLESYKKTVDECTAREQLYSLAQRIVGEKSTNPTGMMRFVFDVLDLHEDGRDIFGRFVSSGAPALVNFAPFAAHVIAVELYFRFAMQRGIVAKERASNWVDIAYLNYMPSCHVFVSTDKLHRDNAPLFQRNYQRFVWGPDLKADLKRLDETYKALPSEVRAQGIMRFAMRPPVDGDFLTARLWDAAMRPEWRTNKPIERSPEQHKRFLESMKAMKEKTRGEMQDAPAFDSDEADSITIERRVRKQKGSWLQLPPEITS